MCGPESCGRSRGRGCASEAERRRPEAQRPRRRLPPPGPQPAPPARGHGGAGAEGGNRGRPEGETRGGPRAPHVPAAEPGSRRRQRPVCPPAAPVPETPRARRAAAPPLLLPWSLLPPTPALSHLTEQRSRKVTKRFHSCRPVPRPDPSAVWGYCGKKGGFQP